jgi:hypothetical protein
METVKNFLKTILPKGAVNKLATLKVNLLGLERGYRHLNMEQVFDKIYHDGD